MIGAAVAPRGVLMQVNRGVGEIPDLVAVAVALPHEVGVIDDILADQIALKLCASDASASVWDAVLLDLAIHQPIAGCPTVAGIGADDIFVQKRIAAHCLNPLKRNKRLVKKTNRESRDALEKVLGDGLDTCLSA